MKILKSIAFHSGVLITLFFLVHCAQSDSATTDTDASEDSLSRGAGSTGDGNQQRPTENFQADIDPEARSIDGTGNNLEEPEEGSVGIALDRLAGPFYADGVNAMGGVDRPGPREISNAICAQTGSLPNSRDLSGFTFAWGQFLDHDLDLTLVDTAEPAPIPVPLGDLFFDPNDTGTQSIAFNRSQFDPNTGTDVDNPREQVNTVTAWIDGSQVYGSDSARAAWLRTGVDGKLKVSTGNLLPFNDGTQVNSPSMGTQFFVAGDVRANEQVVLTALHVLFVREHNRLCSEFKKSHPNWNDERLYQTARRWVGAEIEAITFNEFLPALMGPHAPGAYPGYNSEMEAHIYNEFSTSWFRVGHTMLTNELLILDEANQVLPSGNLALADAFLNPQFVVDHGIDPLLRGLYQQPIEEIDNHIVDGVRNFLFGPPGAGGLDLASLNLQRGRDHGLPDFNTDRESFELPAIQSFAELNSDPEVQTAFQKVYSSVDQIDAWIGALSENHLEGASIGELLIESFLFQFNQLREGDRFWYQNDPAFSAEDVRRIHNTKLSDIIIRNTDIKRLPRNVFFTGTR